MSIPDQDDDDDVKNNEDNDTVDAQGCPGPVQIKTGCQNLRDFW